MKIDKYNKFIKENTREDEYSYLNDELDMWNAGSDYDDDDYDDNEDMEHLLYLLRQMFNNSGISNVEITNKKMDLIIYIRLRTRENLKDIVKIFEVINKLKRDILPQYESEYDLWRTKGNSPLLTFNFRYIEY